MTEAKSLYVILSANASAYRAALAAAARDTDEFGDSVDRAQGRAGGLHDELDDPAVDRYGARIGQTGDRTALFADELDGARGNAVGFHDALDPDRLHQYNDELDATSVRAFRVEIQGADDDVAHLGRSADSAGSSVRGLSSDFDGGGGSIRAFSRDSDDAGDSINRLTGRLGLLARGGVVALPILSSLSAAAVPLLTASANLVGIGALGVGSSAVAFQGVTDAFTALQKFQDMPTGENLEKLHLAFSKLGPDARDLVVSIDALVPALKTVRDASASGLFPGLERSIDDMHQAVPEIRQFVHKYAEAVGDLVSADTESLTTDRWSKFGHFLEREGRPALTKMNAAVGDLVHGLGNLWMAFDPVNDDILTSLTRDANAFDEWTAGLDKTQGFQDFLEYIRTTGPQILHTTGAIGGSILDIGEAAAPFSSSALGGLESFFELLSTFASSDIGQAVFVYASAASAAALAQKAWSAASGTTFAAGIRGQSASIRTLYADLRLLASGYKEAGAAQATMTTGLIAQRVGRTVPTLAKGALLAGGVAAVSSGVADEVGLGNTATGALTGAMIGSLVPGIGTAVGALTGGLIGAYQDVQAESKRTADVTKGLSATFSDQSATAADLSGSLSGSFDELDRFNKHIADMKDTSGVGDWFGDVIGSSKDVFGRTDKDLADLKAQIIDSSEESRALVENLSRIGVALNGGDMHADGGKQLGGDMFDWYWKNYKKLTSNTDFADAFVGNSQKIQAVLNTLQPAMSELGITMDDLQSWDFETEKGQAGMAALVKEVEHLDSASGRAEALSKSIMDLDNGLLSTAESAKLFGTALDEALNPSMNLSEQTDAWVTSLRALNDDLSDNSTTLQGNSNAALQNRGAVRDRVTQIEGLLKAQAEAGYTSKQLARSLQQQTSSLVETGKAAGISRGQMRAYLKTLGLSPKLVRTLVQAAGAHLANAEVRALRRSFGQLPRSVRAVIKTEGIPKTKKDAVELADRLHLVGQPRRALIKLVAEAAKKGITDINKLLDHTDKNDPAPKVTVNTSQANAAIHATQTLLNNLNSKTITITTVHRDRVEKAAGGLVATGLIRGPGGPTDDMIDAKLSNGEFVQPTAAVNYYGVDFMESVRTRRFAQGGYATHRRGYDPDRPVASAYGAGGGGGTVVIQQSRLPDKVILEVDGGRQFTAFVREHAADVAVSAFDGATEDRDQHGRMTWTNDD